MLSVNFASFFLNLPLCKERGSSLPKLPLIARDRPCVYNTCIGDFKVMWVLAVSYVAHGLSYTGNVANALSSTRKPFLPWIIPGHPLGITF